MVAGFLWEQLATTTTGTLATDALADQIGQTIIIAIHFTKHRAHDVDTTLRQLQCGSTKKGHSSYMALSTSILLANRFLVGVYDGGGTSVGTFSYDGVPNKAVSSSKTSMFVYAHKKSKTVVPAKAAITNDVCSSTPT